MNEHAMIRVFGCLALAALMPACGGAVASGAAVGKVGSGLSSHAQAVPEGTEVCTAKEALATAPGAPEKPMSEACVKAQKSDELWRRSMIVLAAYGDMLETLAVDGSETAGQLEAAQTGVSGAPWVDVEDGKEKAARTAVSQIVEQMSTASAKGDLEKALQDAGPHVKTVCDGLVPYLEAQASGLADIQAEVEKKRTSQSDRRCGGLDSRTVCVSDSRADQIVYADAMASLAALQRSHEEARNAVAGFCAAHKKLEAAAAEGNLSDDDTYAGVVDAVKSARRARQSAAPAAAEKPSEPPKK
jgi:hypothetical protein